MNRTAFGIIASLLTSAAALPAGASTDVSLDNRIAKAQAKLAGLEQPASGGGTAQKAADKSDKIELAQHWHNDHHWPNWRNWDNHHWNNHHWNNHHSPFHNWHR